MTNKKSVILKYAIVGVLFGLIFPFGAFIFEMVLNDIPVNLRLIGTLHQSNRLLFMIDSAPLFLGLFAMYGGILKYRSDKMNETNKKELNEAFNGQVETHKITMELVDFIMGTVEKLVNNIRVISDESNNVMQLVESTVQQMKESDKIIASSYDEAVEIKKIIVNNSDDAEKLTKNSQDIMNIIQIMNTVFRKINLLSINASIEAVKAGEQGVGFSVIAQDITQLARETKSSVENIQLQTQDNIALTKSNYEYFQQIKKNIELFIKDFGEMHVELKRVVDEMLKVKNSTENITGKINVFNSSLKSLEEKMHHVTKSTELQH